MSYAIDFEDCRPLGGDRQRARYLERRRRIEPGARQRHRSDRLADDRCPATRLERDQDGPGAADEVATNDQVAMVKTWSSVAGDSSTMTCGAAPADRPWTSASGWAEPAARAGPAARQGPPRRPSSSMPRRRRGRPPRARHATGRPDQRRTHDQRQDATPVTSTAGVRRRPPAAAMRPLNRLPRRSRGDPMIDSGRRSGRGR